MATNDDGDSSSDGPTSLPRGISQRRRGWQGEEMEMMHQREAAREDKSGATAAVDIAQFQNNEVGKGYQAKHVIRQKGRNKSTYQIKDMTGGKIVTKDQDELQKDESGIYDQKEVYIRSSELRDFRRELEKILSS